MSLFSGLKATSLSDSIVTPSKLTVSSTPVNGYVLGYYTGSFAWIPQVGGSGGSVITGDLTESTSNILTISGGTGSVVGLGTSIQVKQASAGQSGYLSSSDWSTFNGKQPALGYTPVPDTRTINSTPLTSNITITKSDLGLSNVSNDAQLKIASNLSDLNNNTTARSNLGLGNSATKDIGTTTGTVCAGDDSRLSDARTPLSHTQAFSTITSTPTTLAGYSISDAVPSSRTINSTPLSSNITLTTADIGDSIDKRYCTDAQKTIIINTSGTNTGNETTTSIGTLINGATVKATPVDADMVGLMDSEATNIIKKLSWSNIKATLKTYFDTVYTLALLGGLAKTSNLSDLNNTLSARNNLGLGNSATKDVGTSAGEICAGNDSRLSDARTPLAHNQAFSTITSTPTTLAGYSISDAVPTSRTVNGHALSSDITVTATDVGLGNCNNTSDANKPVSTATQTALNLKITASTGITGGTPSSF